MNNQRRNGIARRLRWRLGSLMIAIAVISIALALAQPFATPAPVRAARAVLELYVAVPPEPALKSEDYRADSVLETSFGYTEVRFVRVRGHGPPECVAKVSDRSVNAARLNPWWKPPLYPERP